MNSFSLLLAIGGIAAINLLSSCKEDTPNRPNVIYISIEDAMPNLGCYGDSIAYTPHIDAFAKESVRFADAHCQVALCTPSRTSILTGIRPSTSGIVKIDDDWRVLLPRASSLPRHFRDHGYYTSLAGKIHDYRCGGMDSAYTIVHDEHGLKDNTAALAALRDVASQENPFLLAIGYSQAHDPWTPSAGAKRHYSIDQFTAEGRAPIYKGKEYDERGIKELQLSYYGEITEVDSLVGEVLREIKALGLYENSIILVGVMDHGYNFGHRGRWGKGNNYDNETQVPLLIRVPESPNHGRSATGIVELVDLYPTLVDLCGLPQPNHRLEGFSLRGLLNNPDREWKKAAITHRAYAVDIIGVKTREYNFIDFAGDSVALYDRRADPLNLINIAEENPGIVREMSSMAKAGWISATPDVHKITE